MEKTSRSIKSFWEVFAEKFGLNAREQRHFFAPGRVNLIGEHTDYNGGHVFPCALQFGTHIFMQLRDDDNIQALSLNFPNAGVLKTSINKVVYQEELGWLNYVMGVVSTMEKRGYKIKKGFDMLVFGTIPNGAGLSSSASLELATAVMLNNCFEHGIDSIELVEICQYAENHFNGVKCGIMDQFAIGMAKKNHAILLNCHNLDYKHVPFHMPGYNLIVMNTKKTRSLTTSLYNERRLSCERAFEDIKSQRDISCLSDVSTEEFSKVSHFIKIETDRKRARHVITENERVLKAVEALLEKKLQTFGHLMKESHMSLKEDYEVTGKELDTIVDLALSTPGTLGARMTGAGFGGCAVAIVEETAVEAFQKNVGKKYTEKIGYPPAFYIGQLGDKAREILTKEGEIL